MRGKAPSRGHKSTGPVTSAAPVRVGVVRLSHSQGLPLPTYQSPGAAGLDLVAALDAKGPMMLAPGARVLVPTGLIIELPLGYEAQVRPRSGLALNHGVTVLNSPGTIDSDYRGEVRIILANLGQAPFEIRRGERIAQLVISPVTHATFAEVNEVSNTLRGKGGFGSTGKSSAKENAPTRKPPTQKKSMPATAAPSKKTRQTRPPGRNR
ncbi:MAG: dUTP diphosphatase [Hyphomicrobium sp.]